MMSARSYSGESLFPEKLAGAVENLLAMFLHLLAGDLHLVNLTEIATRRLTLMAPRVRIVGDVKQLARNSLPCTTAKGREYQAVAMMDLHEGRIPFYQCETAEEFIGYNGWTGRSVDIGSRRRRSRFF
jgi:hypothetical protein